MSSTLLAIKGAFAKAAKLPDHAVTGDLRVGDHLRDELSVIEFVMRVEELCHCDIPDYQITPLLTLAQLATLAETHRQELTR